MTRPSYLACHKEVRSQSCTSQSVTSWVRWRRGILSQNQIIHHVIVYHWEGCLEHEPKSRRWKIGPYFHRWYFHLSELPVRSRDCSASVVAFCVYHAMRAVVPVVRHILELTAVFSERILVAVSRFFFIAAYSTNLTFSSETFEKERRKILKNKSWTHNLPNGRIL